jgi:hypothetical protein
VSEQEIVTSIADRLKASGDVKVVFGEPQVIEGKTIVPVAAVAYGFGGGTGGGPQGEGHGGGGGLRAAAGRSGITPSTRLPVTPCVWPPWASGLGKPSGCSRARSGSGGEVRHLSGARSGGGRALPPNSSSAAADSE